MSDTVILDAIMRVERFAKGPNTTPEEHDDIMLLVNKLRSSLVAAPTDRIIQALISVPVRWHPYKPGSQEVKRGKMGRWQSMNEFGGWQNLRPNKPPERWQEVADTLEGSNLKP